MLMVRAVWTRAWYPCRIPYMDKLKARVVNGRIILDEPCDLPDGTVVDLAVVDEGDDLDDEERQQLNAALDRAWKSLRSGEPGIPAEKLLEELRKRG